MIIDNLLGLIDSANLTKETNMKKVLAILISSVFISSFAYAGQCPALLKQVDAKIATTKLAGDNLKAVKTLRDKGDADHKAGKHADSEKALQEALKKLG